MLSKFPRVTYIQSWVKVDGPTSLLLKTGHFVPQPKGLRLVHYGLEETSFPEFRYVFWEFDPGADLMTFKWENSMYFDRNRKIFNDFERFLAIDQVFKYFSRYSPKYNLKCGCDRFFCD